MEVYSIIKNLDEGLLKGELPAIYDGFVRNKGLLIKYSQQFRNSNPTMFIRKVRSFLREEKKQNKIRNSLPLTLKCEGLEQNQNGRENSPCLNKRFQSGLFMNKRYRKSSITGLMTPQSGQKMLSSSKLARILRGGQEQLHWKPNIISLGENITNFHEKIKEAIERRSRKPKSPLKQIHTNNHERMVPPTLFFNYTLNCYPRKHRM